MYSRDTRGDDECTAAPGVGGWRSCHRYPGCGCGRSEPEVEKPTQQATQVEYYTPPSNWKLIPFQNVVKLSKGMYVAEFHGDKLYTKFPISAKIVPDGLLIHKDTIKKYDKLGDIFVCQNNP